MRHGDARKFGALVRALRRELPAAYPVTVRRATSGEGALGYCALRCRGRRWRFVVVIDRSSPFLVARDTLIHEWAHALSWSAGHPSTTDHDEMWGVCYSKCYRALFPDSEPTED